MFVHEQVLFACHSPRLVIAEARARGGMTMSKTFMRRLVWRDLAYWQLHHWPDMALNPIRRHYVDQVCCCGGKHGWALHSRCRVQTQPMHWISCYRCHRPQL